MPCHAADVDDRADTALRHSRRDARCEVEGGAHIVGEQFVQYGGLELRRRAEPGEARVVDQDVDGAYRVDEPVDVREVAEVRLYEPSLSS